MLCFLSVVQAVFIYHRATKQFLGVEKKDFFHVEMIAPVKDVTKALDFRIREGAVTAKPDYNRITLGETITSNSNLLVRIAHPSANKSFDVYYGRENNGEVIIYPSHNIQSNQQFQFVLRPDFGIVIKWHSRCLIYNSVNRAFYTGSCSDTKQSVFDFYMETSPEKKEEREEIYDLKEPTDMSYIDANVINYQHGTTNAKFISPPEKEATKIVYNEGKKIKVKTPKHEKGECGDVKVSKKSVSGSGKKVSSKVKSQKISGNVDDNDSSSSYEEIEEVVPYDLKETSKVYN